MLQRPADLAGTRAAIVGIPFDRGTHPNRIGVRLYSRVVEYKRTFTGVAI
jgi:hypothetical protein